MIYQNKEILPITATEILLAITFAIIVGVSGFLAMLWYSYPVVQFTYPGKECIRVIPTNGQYSCSYLPQKYHAEWVSNKAKRGE